MRTGFFVGQILPELPEDGDEIGHVDFASSYPAQMICSAEFPAGRLMDCTSSVQKIDDLEYYCKNYWVILRVIFEDLELKNPYFTKCPYIPVSKTIREPRRRGIYDNGRIIKQPGYVEFCFLGCEWPIIRQQYQGKIITIKEAYYAPKGYLPGQIRQECLKWYRLKTELKGVEGKKYEYMKAKNRTNSSYGMAVEKPIKDIMSVDELLNIKMQEPSEDESRNQLEKFYSPMQRKFLAYQWGITVTALARIEHMRMIAICGNDFIYGDTDSVFFLHPELHKEHIENYNKVWMKYALSCGLPFSATDPEGTEHPLGVAEWEESCTQFVTLGAKKYALKKLVMDKKTGEQREQLEITVAGVPKKQGSALLGDLKKFRPEFVFMVSDDASLEERQGWKKTLHYHDTGFMMEIDGHILDVGSGIGMTRTPYEMDLKPEYRMLTGYQDIELQDDVF